MISSDEEESDMDDNQGEDGSNSEDDDTSTDPDLEDIDPEEFDRDFLDPEDMMGEEEYYPDDNEPFVRGRNGRVLYGGYGRCFRCGEISKYFTSLSANVKSIIYLLFSGQSGHWVPGCPN